MSTVYPSKVLLFGEYTIIQGSAALAVPYYRYRTFWSDAGFPVDFELSLPQVQCQAGLWRIYEELEQKKLGILNLPLLKKALEEGLWLVSNSPIGYGLGSSGAVCAALYDRFALLPNADLIQLQQILAALEGSFHGKSSGVDPLVSLKKQPLWVHPNGLVQPTALANLSEVSVFLLDSQHPRVSTPLIEFFVQQSKQDRFLQDFVAPVSEAVDCAIAAWQKDNAPALLESVALISEKQLAYLSPMVLSQWRALWKKGLETGAFYLKICGAGGGGFLLGFARGGADFDWGMLDGFRAAGFSMPVQVLEV
jgi:mevalonate kinase